MLATTEPAVHYLRGNGRARYRGTMATVETPPPAGALLREWRTRRRMSQLDLALDADVSTRHLSFVETGRSRPSASLLLHLAERLDVPLRDRNQLLLAAGHAPLFGQHDFDAPELGPVREAIERVLAAQDPYPALVVDGHWGLVAANRAVAVLTEGAAPWLLEPPVNVLRLSLHPEGVASRIVNLPQWRSHVLERLTRQAAATADTALAALYAELAALPGGEDPSHGSQDPIARAIAVPLRLRPEDWDGELTFLSTVTTFGTATDVTVSELTIESFFPADGATEEALRAA